MPGVKGRVTLLKEFFFDSREEMQAALQEDCMSLLQAALQQRDRISLLVSGGSSPEPLYRALSCADLPWEKITLALVDERWVACDHDKSNEAFIRRTLLTNKAARAEFVGMKNSASTAAGGRELCVQAYNELPQPWSLCLLGMGSDGHTASLFPHAQGLDLALDVEAAPICVDIVAHQSEVTGAITERMSLSLAGLLKAERLVLLISGEEKRRIYEAAKAGDDIAEMPVRAVLQQSQVPVDVYWAPN